MAAARPTGAAAAAPAGWMPTWADLADTRMGRVVGDLYRRLMGDTIRWARNPLGSRIGSQPLWVVLSFCDVETLRRVQRSARSEGPLDLDIAQGLTIQLKKRDGKASLLEIMQYKKLLEQSRTIRHVLAQVRNIPGEYGLGGIISDARVMEMIQECPNLTAFGLVGPDRRTTDEVLAPLAERPLTALDLCGCKDVTNATLARLSHLRLTSLTLQACPRITDAGLAQLSRMPLTSLNFCLNNRITNVGLAHLSGIDSLRSLEFSCYQQVTDAGLAHLARLPLTSLHISFGRRLTDAGLAHLARMPLTNLDLEVCPHVTQAGVDQLREEHPGIRIKRG